MYKQSVTGKKTVFVLVFASIGLVFSLPAFSQGLQNRQNLAAIKDVTENFVRDELKARQLQHQDLEARLDPRLQLVSCQSPLQPGWKRPVTFTNALLVEVRCLDTPGWRLYVPTRVSYVVETLVARRHLKRGDTLSENDVQPKKIVLQRLLYNSARTVSEITGKQVKRTIREGASISLDNLQAAPIVLKGQQVVVIARSAGVEIRSMAEALQDGARGERISLRNIRSARLLEGIVQGSGKVMVPL